MVVKHVTCVIEGNIGSGKTYTLKKLLGYYKVYTQNFKAIQKLLKDYNEKKNEGFNSYELQKAIFGTYKDQWDESKHYEDIVCYEAIWSNFVVFTRYALEHNLITKEQYELLKKECCPSTEMAPDVFVYIWTRDSTSIERLKKRANYKESSEDKLDENYFKDIKKLYNEFFELDEEELLKSNDVLMLKKDFYGSTLLVLNNDNEENIHTDYLVKLINEYGKKSKENNLKNSLEREIYKIK